MEYTVNASGRPIGRVATEVAKVLMGKHLPSYTPNNPPMVKVTVENIGKMAISERRVASQTYQRYSGYPGGLKIETLPKVMEKKGPQEILRLAVIRMLPNNRLRTRRMKNLIIRD